MTSFVLLEASDAAFVVLLVRLVVCDAGPRRWRRSEIGEARDAMKLGGRMPSQRRVATGKS